jgi:hypothetical protein
MGLSIGGFDWGAPPIWLNFNEDAIVRDPVSGPAPEMCTFRGALSVRPLG